MSHEAFVSDVQVVRDSTAAGTTGILLKQLAAIGCPSWRMKFNATEGEAPVFRIFGHCSDRGSDQVKLRRFIRHEVLPLPRCFYFDWDCSQHANALIFKDSLLLVDDWLREQGFSVDN
jgi:hypothetical protein